MKNIFSKNIRRDINKWSILTIVLVAIILLPNLNVMSHLFIGDSSNWQHIKEYMLKDYVLNTLILVAFTGVITAIIGVFLAWIVSIYDFPFKKFFKWALILPLAFPPNISAYTYNGIVGYTGIIQKILREFNINYNPEHFDIMTIWGAVFIFSITLYPYVYMVTKTFLNRQSTSIIETARVLGAGPIKLFFKVAMPISRTAIIGGVSLVVLEVLNDFGVVQYYGINTLSTAIFKTWFGMYDLASATKLAGILMITVFIFLALEKASRGRKKYSLSTSKQNPIKPKKITGIKGWLLTGISAIVFIISFLIPFIQITVWTFKNYKHVLNEEFIRIIGNTILVGAISAILIVTLGIIIGNTYRISKTREIKWLSKLVNLGYSIPGTVIAIGVLTVFIALDKMIFGEKGGLVLSSTIWMLVFAFIIRYFAIGFNSIEAGFEKIGTNYFNASRLLGYGITKTFFKVDLKMIKGSIFAGLILVFIDVMKELPLTLILRPFNFDTLATKTYEYATDEMINMAAVPAFIIILISAIVIIIFTRLEEKK